MFLFLWKKVLFFASSERVSFVPFKTKTLSLFLCTHSRIHVECEEAGVEVSVPVIRFVNR